MERPQNQFPQRQITSQKIPQICQSPSPNRRLVNSISDSPERLLLLYSQKKPTNQDRETQSLQQYQTEPQLSQSSAFSQTFFRPNTNNIQRQSLPSPYTSNPLNSQHNSNNQNNLLSNTQNIRSNTNNNNNNNNPFSQLVERTIQFPTSNLHIGRILTKSELLSLKYGNNQAPQRKSPNLSSNIRDGNSSSNQQSNSQTNDNIPSSISSFFSANHDPFSSIPAPQVRPRLRGNVNNPQQNQYPQQAPFLSSSSSQQSSFSRGERSAAQIPNSIRMFQPSNNNLQSLPIPNIPRYIPYSQVNNIQQSSSLPQRDNNRNQFTQPSNQYQSNNIQTNQRIFSSGVPRTAARQQQQQQQYEEEEEEKKQDVFQDCNSIDYGQFEFEQERNQNISIVDNDPQDLNNNQESMNFSFNNNNSPRFNQAIGLEFTNQLINSNREDAFRRNLSETIENIRRQFEPKTDTQKGLSQQQIKEFPTVKLKEIEKDEICSICLENLLFNELVKILGCMHRFHSRCVGKWLKKKAVCPVCVTDQQQFFENEEMPDFLKENDSISNNQQRNNNRFYRV